MFRHETIESFKVLILQYLPIGSIITVTRNFFSMLPTQSGLYFFLKYERDFSRKHVHQASVKISKIEVYTTRPLHKMATLNKLFSLNNYSDLLGKKCLCRRTCIKLYTIKKNTVIYETGNTLWYFVQDTEGYGQDCNVYKIFWCS